MTQRGHVTPKGYRRFRHGGRFRMEHDVVWEEHHGRPVPPGHDVHHVDFDKLNNVIENLVLLTKLEHKRIHSGCEIRDGVWWKPCRLCGEMKPLTREHWYFIPSGSPAYGHCKRCDVKRTVQERRVRKLRDRAP